MSAIIRISFIVLLSMIEVFSADPPITSLAFTPDQRSVIAGSQDGIAVFSWPNLKLERRFDVDMLNVHSLSFSDNGEHLAIGGGNPAETGIVEVLHWIDQKSIGQLSHHEDSVLDVIWLDGKRVLSASLDRGISASEVKVVDSKSEFLGHSKGVTAICILNDKRTLISGGVDQSVRVWDIYTGKLVRSLNQHTGPINDIARRPLGNGLPIVASAASDRTIRFWQPTIGRMLRYIRLDSPPQSLVWLPGGERIAAACADGFVRIIDTIDLEVIESFACIDGWAYAIIYHPDDRTMVVGGSNGTVMSLKEETFVP